MQLRIGLDAAGDFESIHSRHPVVDHHRVGSDLRRESQAFLARGGHADVVAVALQKAPRHLQVVRAVIDDDDPFPLGHGFIGDDACF